MSESEYEVPVTRSNSRKRPRLNFSDTESATDDDNSDSDEFIQSNASDNDDPATHTSEDAGAEANDNSDGDGNVDDNLNGNGNGNGEEGGNGGGDGGGNGDEDGDRDGDGDGDGDGDNDDEDQVNQPELGEPQVLTQNTNNRCYLITYSQCDKDLFPTRQDFGEECVDAFGGPTKVDQFACAEEVHRTGGTHYHVSMKLVTTSRWLHAKNYLARKGAVVNFARPPVGGVRYAWIYRYITKYDTNVFHSQGHQSLERIEASRCVEQALLAVSRNNADGGEEGSKSGKKIRLTDSDVAQYCRKKNIKTLTELMADGEMRMGEGDSTLHDYIFSRSLKHMAELLVKTEWMEQAPGTIQRKSVPRLAIVSSSREKECVEKCNGLWYKCAIDILKRSSINKYVFAHAIRQLLEHGRGRKRNIFLLGPTASGKTFLLKPLLELFPDHFANPPASSFGWLGADEARIILLNDYRWENKRNGGNIEWGALLNLLEGFKTKLPAPMNSFAKHIVIDTDVPVFGTGPELIRWYSNSNEEARGKKHAKEDSQIDDRWVTFEFKHTFPKHERVEAASCVSCFAKFCHIGYDD